MAGIPETERPTFTADDSSLLSLKLLHEGINREPQTYFEALHMLQGVTLDGGSTPATPLPEPIGSAHALLTKVFSEHDDREITYDGATDASLEKDSTFRELLAEMAKHKTRTTKGRNAVRIVDPEAEVVRDKIRILTLGHYIGRVIAWQSEHSETGGDEQLRTAG